MDFDQLQKELNRRPISEEEIREAFKRVTDDQWKFLLDYFKKDDKEDVIRIFIEVLREDQIQ